MVTEPGLPNGRLSWSVVASYLRCPECCYRHYVLQEATERPLSLTLGTAIHAGVSAARIALKWGVTATPESLLLCYQSAALEALEQEAMNAGVVLEDKPEWVDQVTRCGPALAEAIAQEISLFQPDHILRVEKWSEFGFIFPFRFSGRTDIEIGNGIDGVTHIRDFKTAQHTRKPDEFEQTQLAVYALPYFPIGNPGAKLQVGIDRIALGNKTPKLTRYDWTIGQHEMLEAKDLVIEVANNMLAGRWTSKSRSWSCTYEHWH